MQEGVEFFKLVQLQLQSFQCKFVQRLRTIYRLHTQHAYVHSGTNKWHSAAHLFGNLQTFYIRIIIYLIACTTISFSNM